MKIGQNGSNWFKRAQNRSFSFQVQNCSNWLKILFFFVQNVSCSRLVVYSSSQKWLLLYLPVTGIIKTRNYNLAPIFIAGYLQIITAKQLFYASNFREC